MFHPERATVVNINAEAALGKKLLGSCVHKDTLWETNTQSNHATPYLLPTITYRQQGLVWPLGPRLIL